MNERIKELAKEAGYYLYDLTETHECKTVETDSEDEWITLEKFAELIVEECCAQVERQYKYATKQTSTWSMSQDVQDMLKKHFGVEE